MFRQLEFREKINLFYVGTVLEIMSDNLFVPQNLLTNRRNNLEESHIFVGSYSNLDDR